MLYPDEEAVPTRCGLDIKTAQVLFLPAFKQGMGAKGLETLAPTLQRLMECGGVSRSSTPLFGNSQKATVTKHQSSAS